MGQAIGNDVTYTGNPASFTGKSGVNMKSVVVPLTYSQDLHGYSKPWGPGGGVNLFDVDTAVYYTGLGGNANKFGHSFNLAGTYALKLFQNGGSGLVRYYIHKSDNSWVGPSTITTTGTTVSVASGDTLYVIDNAYAGSETETGRANAITLFNNWEVSVALSASQPDQYYPYSNICPISGLTGLSLYVSPTQDQQDATIHTADWTSQAGTVCSGSADIVKGEVIADMMNIASYAGETIEEPWLSSMDEFSPGATPTTGAQVVYTLSTPVTYQFTGLTIPVLAGQNYVWSSNNQTLTVVIPGAGFNGWLIKVVNNGTPVEIPLKYIRAETYTVTPDQRMEWSAERDVTGVLHRETVPNTPPKIEFTTPLMTNSDIAALNTIIQSAFTNVLGRDITVQFYDPEKDEYWQWDCYMPDVHYSIRNVDIVNNIINYEELRYAFIGY